MNINPNPTTNPNTTPNPHTNTIELEIQECASEQVESIPTPTLTPTPTPTTIPKIVFIIPYRDRVEHKEFFTIYMKHVLEDIPKTSYEIYFVEQKNTLPFNRGAMKNIGFLALKYKYPNDYKNITFVFNDVDTVPYSKNIIDYETTHGIVKHFYGFKFALGGIFSIKGEDFERTNGFPNFWAWGGEDNYMQKRVEYVGLYIDRSVFFNILDKNILQLCDGVKRLICRKEAATVVNMTTSDGLITIRNLNYEFKDEYINVYNFQTMRDPRVLRFEEQNIAVESKIRLEKEDVKNILDRKMNKNIGVHNNNIRAPHTRQPIQHQNVILPRRPSTVPLPPQSHQHQQQPSHQQQPPQQQQHHPHQQPIPQSQQSQQLKKYVYRGIGMGGIH